jgi:hypothetical protein
MLYDSYRAHRPAILQAWAAGDGQDVPGDLRWQAELWRRVRSRIGLDSPIEWLAPPAQPATTRRRLPSTAKSLDTAVIELPVYRAHRYLRGAVIADSTVPSLQCQNDRIVHKDT